MASAVTGRTPLRISSSSVSTPCVKPATSAKPKVAEPPLMEWAARKIVLIFSLSAVAPRLRSPDSITSSPSRLSWKNTLAISAISKSKVMLDSFGTWVWLRASGSQDASDRSKQLRRIEWLDDPTGGTGAFTIHFFLLARLGREYQHRHELVVQQAPQFTHQSNAVHAWHMHIGEDQIDGGLPRQFHRLHAVPGLHHLVSAALHAAQHHLTHRSP